MLDAFVKKMEDAGEPSMVIDTFRYYYNLLVHGHTGLILESDIEPIPAGSIPRAVEMAAYADRGKAHLRQTAIVKLNGGLGTTMGLDGPKGLLTVKNDLAFFDIIAHQVRNLSARCGQQIPLIMMSSFSTHQKSIDYLQRYSELDVGAGKFFQQHKFPKVLKGSLEPASWPQNPALEWNPPGHGDIYAALATSGALQQLLAQGVTYLFISNIDNLGATLDLGMLGYFATHDLPCMMEVAQRTAMDKKGGHLARRKTDGQLILRELAQTSHDEVDRFQDVETYGYFNTNTLWLNIGYLAKILKQHAFLALPMIRNEKNLDPRDPSSPLVIQIESAMGAAISLFEGAQAIEVPSTRFLPVKRCEELLLLRSDRFLLNADYEVSPNPACSHPHCVVTLDSRFYGTIALLDQHFPAGIPSMLDCTSLTIRGDVRFGKNSSIVGDIIIENLSTEPKTIPDFMAVNESITFS
jgi:UTP--glucose-1-phosphate uridylyltransferase